MNNECNKLLSQYKEISYTVSLSCVEAKIDTSLAEDSDQITFVNEHQLNIKNRKHNVDLHLGIDNVGNVTDDQTPTPTRFIRKCEEVGLFQDLQNVNPFEETFRKAATELATHGSLPVPKVTSNDDSLHTPHIFPYIPQEEKFSNSDDFCVKDDILVIDESKVNHPLSFNFSSFEKNVDGSEVASITKNEYGNSKNVKVKRCTHIQKQRELNRAAQVRSRAKKKLMLHKLVEEVSLLKSQTKGLVKDNEKLRREVVWLKTMLLYHKDCPVSKDPQIIKEVNLRAKAAGEKEKSLQPVTTMLVPVHPNPSVITPQLPQLVRLQPVNAAVLVQVPMNNVSKPTTSKLTPLLPKTLIPTETSRVSVETKTTKVRDNNRRDTKKGKHCVKLRLSHKQLPRHR